MTKGGLELKPEQAKRLESLKRGCGYRGGRGIFVARPGHVKITADQLLQVKHLSSTGLTNVQIQTKTSLSEWIVRGAIQGRYDALLEENQHGSESK